MKNKGSKQKKPSKNGSGGGDDGKKIITDPRFVKVHTDPRFRKVPKHKSKVVIDSRFSRIFTDKRFFASRASLDKRGKPKKQQENALRRYYRVEEEREGREEEEDREEDEEQGNKSVADVEVGSEESEATDSEGEELKSSEQLLPLKPLAEEEEDTKEEDEGLESDATDSTTDTDTDDEGYEVDMDDDADVEVEDVPVIEKETRRLAVVNMDWDHVKAEDLFMLLRSFLPRGGEILSVAVYFSEFGSKRIAEESTHGPVGLFDDDKLDDVSDDEDDEIDMVKRREYAKSRMRYFYAVVECDSSATADHLYKNCDGLEFEKSSNVLDLRFIPDSMEFKHLILRESATMAPATYDGLDFQTLALQHTNVPLSWDEDEPHRVKALKRKFNEEELAELEFKEFLASDESESDEDGDENGDGTNEIHGKKTNKREMYKALLQSGDDSEKEEDEGQEMEVTFNTGLEDLSKQMLEKRDKKSETVWEAYLRRRKEKRKSRKNKSAHSSDDESDDTDEEPPEQHSDDDFFEEEPAPVKKKKAGRKKDNQPLETDKEAEASRAELELLLADANGAENNPKGYKIKPKKSKGRKGKEEINEEKVPAANYEDPRFAALFNNPHFALDPTDPQFKRSAVYARQMAKQQRKKGEVLVEEQPKEPEPLMTEAEDLKSSVPSSHEKRELSSLVRSIKMKSKQISVPSTGKIKKRKM